MLLYRFSREPIDISSSEFRKIVAITFWMSLIVFVRYIPIILGGIGVCFKR